MMPTTATPLRVVYQSLGIARALLPSSTVIISSSSSSSSTSTSTSTSTSSSSIRFSSARTGASTDALHFRSNYGNLDTTTTHSSQQHKKKRTTQSPKEQRDSGRASYRFVDRTRVRVSGGSGGNGSTSFFKLGRKHKRRPDGGHGGNGGSVIIVADPKQQSLRWTHPHVTAETGAHGSSQNKHGKNGSNTVLRVPCGVVVRRVLDHDERWNEQEQRVWKTSTNEIVISTDAEESSDDVIESDGDDDVDETVESFWPNGQRYRFEDLDNEEMADSFIPWKDREKVFLDDLDEPGSYIIVARGGAGGTGTSSVSSRHGIPPPLEDLALKAKPHEGEAAFLELELKLIADVGLVGFPNAGKSSLLAAMSRATPHIAPYPFTTLNPLVGNIDYTDGFRVIAADVPGLIAGASEGRGKGHDFLRHLERTKALLYIVDAASVDGRNPIDDMRTLVHELSNYGDGDMLTRPALVVANKMDLLRDEERHNVLSQLQSLADEATLNAQFNVAAISAGVTGEGLDDLSKQIRSIVEQRDSEETDSEFRVRTG